MLLSGYQKGPAFASHSGINNHQVHSVYWKVRIGLRNGERAIKNVKRLNGVTNVDDLGRRIDVQYHALHSANEIVVQAEVGGKRD